MLLIIVVFGKLFLQCRKLNIRLIPQSLNRGKAVPGGVCGFWGACGVGISAGGRKQIDGVIVHITEQGFPFTLSG